MQKYHNTIQDKAGNIITTAIVTVYDAGTLDLASIYEDDGFTALPNPFSIADNNYNLKGAFFFKALNGDYDIKIDNGGGNVVNVYDVTLFDFEDATPKNFDNETTDPTVNDDEGSGAELGSRWINTVTKEIFRCVDTTGGAAVWIETTLEISELGTMATQDANAIAVTGGTMDGVAITGGSASGLTSLQVSGNITLTGTVDGRDIATDGTKLDGIEPGADVTDATNVDAAGAVMEADTSTASMGFVIDEDTMLSNSDTKVPTQQSVKTYVDNTVASNVSYQGGYDASTNTPNLDTSPAGVLRGHMWTCTVAGTAFFTVNLEVGDVLIAEQDDPTLETHWTVVNKNLDANSILAALLTVDGSTSGLDADLLDGQEGSFYRDAGNINAGTLPVSRGGTGVTTSTGTGNTVRSASPALTGTPTAPTAPLSTNTTQIATTAFVLANGGTGDMLKSENLSGLANYTTARSNLGLGGLATLSGVGQGEINANSVGQSEVKTTYQEVSSSTGSQTYFVATGGVYCIGHTGQGTNYLQRDRNDGTSTTYVSSWSTGNDIGVRSIRLYYINSSPPYNLGDGDIPMFVYAIIDNTTGAIESVSTSVDPTWAYNGRTDCTPCRYDKVTGKSYIKRKDMSHVPFTYEQALLDPVKLSEYISEFKIAEDIELELTQEIKNADMNCIPHAFHGVGNNLSGKTVVMLDPVSTVMEDLLAIQSHGDSDIAKIVSDGYLTIGNTQLNRVTPNGVLIPSVKWKNTL